MVEIGVKQGTQNVGILGLGVYRPSRVVTNDEICQTLDSSDEWIRERSGIASRRWVSQDETALSMSAAAAERAIENSGVAKSDIGALILATGSWRTKIPAGGPQVANAIGIDGIPAFEVNVGCAGFGYGLSVASDMVRAGTTKYVVVIGVETLSVVLDNTDRNTAFIFGDGAGAVVVGPSEVNGISPTVWGSDGENALAISQNWDIPDYMDRAEAAQNDPDAEPIGRMVITMQGPKVFRWAAITLPKALSAAIEQSGVAKEDIEVFIPHQANSRINELMKANIGLGDHVPVANDIETAGNTSAASIPLAMEEMLVNGKAKEGQIALLLGFGAGLSYAGCVVRLPPAPAEASAR